MLESWRDLRGELEHVVAPEGLQSSNCACMHILTVEQLQQVQWRSLPVGKAQE
jgi:hypothetical protein